MMCLVVVLVMVLVFLPKYDAAIAEPQRQVLLETVECKMYHDACMHLERFISFANLRNFTLASRFNKK
jgi:hypothetical protein